MYFIYLLNLLTFNTTGPFHTSALCHIPGIECMKPDLEVVSSNPIKGNIAMGPSHPSMVRVWWILVYKNLNHLKYTKTKLSYLFLPTTTTTLIYLFITGCTYLFAVIIFLQVHFYLILYQTFLCISPSNNPFR